MAQRIEIICFAASYGVALALELTRVFFRSGLRGMLMIGFAAAGLVAHTLFLWHRYSLAEAPLSSAFDWYLMAAWCLAAIYLYLAYYHPTNANGVFILPLVLVLIGVATFLADREPFPATLASRYWGALHGVFLLLGTISVMLGFAAGLMYLIQAYRLKHKLRPVRGFQLPSLEWLARFNTRAIVVSLITLAIGVVSGSVLNVINHGRQVDELAWTDPVVLTSNLAVVWLFVATLFTMLYKPARQGHKVAYLTVASFVFLLITLGVSLLVNTEHSGRRAAHGQRQLPTAGAGERGELA